MAKKERNEVVVTSLSDLISLMANAANKGEYVTLYAESSISGLLMFPTDGSEKIHRVKELGFNPTTRYHVTYHFGEDYEKAMSKALGEDYKKSSKENIQTLISGIMMRYRSTNNPCFIYMKGDYVSEGKFNNGNPYTAADEATEKRYTSLAPKKDSNPVEYRTLGVKNVTRLTAHNVVYRLQITDWELPAEFQTIMVEHHEPAYATA